MSRESVEVFTGLPPQVDGQLRCFLKFHIKQICWSILNPPDVTHVRVQWWGEQSGGAIFR